MNDTELRDHFAALAMAAFINMPDVKLTWKQICALIGEDEKTIPTKQGWREAAYRCSACMAYKQADAMMIYRKHHPTIRA